MADEQTPATPPDDQMAEEWAQMAKGGGGRSSGGDSGSNGGGADPTSSRVLDQAEIDSLLGFGGAADSMPEQSGIRAIVNSALVSYERLPMLEVVFDRLVRLMSTSLLWPTSCGAPRSTSRRFSTSRRCR